MARAPKLIYGTSGSIIEMRLNEVVKRSDYPQKQEFLMEQSAYMQMHGTPFAKVLWRLDGAYATQPLRPLQHKTPLAVLLTHARGSLHPLWDRPAVPAPGWALKLGAYIGNLCLYSGLPNKVRIQEHLLAMLDRVSSRTGTIGSTHGDATLDNAMRNDYEELVWIDPIPHRENIPPLIGVDLGKLLQSACGYERIKYGAESTWCTPIALDQEVVLEGLSEDDVFSARFFHCLAYLRGLRYFTGPVLNHAYRMLEELTK